jgi:hypothetical protein
MPKKNIRKIACEEGKTVTKDYQEKKLASVAQNFNKG